MFNDFDDLFDDFFSKAYSRWNSPVKDMQPFKAFYVDGKGYVVVCKTLGISKENIKVNVSKEKATNYRVLQISGESKLPKIDFENKVDLGIRLKFDDEIEEIQYDVKDGLTTIFIKLKEKEQPKDNITVKYIEDSGDSTAW